MQALKKYYLVKERYLITVIVTKLFLKFQEANLRFHSLIATATQFPLGFKPNIQVKHRLKGLLTTVFTLQHVLKILKVHTNVANFQLRLSFQSTLPNC